jgi:hypothetical protein
MTAAAQDHEDITRDLKPFTDLVDQTAAPGYVFLVVPRGDPIHFEGQTQWLQHVGLIFVGMAEKNVSQNLAAAWFQVRFGGDHRGASLFRLGLVQHLL